MQEKIFFALAAVCALAACQTQKAAAPSNGFLPPPPSAAVQHITAADDGKFIEVAVDTPFAVELVGAPTAGYLWKAVAKPDFLKETGTTGGPTTEAQKQPGFAGGSHWEVTTFVAERAGRGVLKFEQRRPWQTTEPAVNSFVVFILAK